MRDRQMAFRDQSGDGTHDVAALINALTLPIIEPFGLDNLKLVGLPPITPASRFPADPELGSVPERELEPGVEPELDAEIEADPVSQFSVARSVYDSAVTALAALKRLEDATAACKAAVVARMLGAVRVEATALALDLWQTQTADLSAHTDIAVTLSIPERTAAALAHQSSELIESHPETAAALEEGKLSWRHAVIIMDECSTLHETPSITAEDLAAFEQRLLLLAPGSTASGFAAKARRAREGTHPETLIIRTKLAYANREMTLDPDKDGMSWLTLHLPAPAAEGIWVHCTRAARELKNHNLTNNNLTNRALTNFDGERAQDNGAGNRTLAQLRIDLATALLLGQHPLTTQSSPRHTSPTADTSPTDGGSTLSPGGSTSRRNGSTSRHGASTSRQSANTSPHHEPSIGSYGTLAGQNPIQGSGPIKGSSLPEGTGLTEGTGLMKGFSKTDGLVDGIVDDPLQDYLGQLEATRLGKIITDPPQPVAQILVTVPVLSVLGITDDPAELAGYGPISTTIARKLLVDAGTFLRVLVDPISGKPLNASPERYRVREAERAILRSISDGCYFPNCTNPVLDTELDHLRAFEHGGKSTTQNVKPACKRHHLLKHFKDDKDKHGRYRLDRDPARARIKLRGWTPSVTPDGRVGWLSPSGNYHPPLECEDHSPSYPKRLKKHLDQTLKSNLSEPLNEPLNDNLEKPLSKTLNCKLDDALRSVEPKPLLVPQPGPNSETPACKSDYRINGLRLSPFEHLLVDYLPPHAA